VRSGSLYHDRRKSVKVGPLERQAPGDEPAHGIVLDTEHNVERAHEVLARYPGRCDVALVVETHDDTNPAVRLRYELTPSAQLKVAADPKMAAELQEILGAGNVQLVSKKPRSSSGPANTRGPSTARRPTTSRTP
jgi:hypothetical protein